MGRDETLLVDASVRGAADGGFDVPAGTDSEIERVAVPDEAVPLIDVRPLSEMPVAAVAIGICPLDDPAESVDAVELDKDALGRDADGLVLTYGLTNGVFGLGPAGADFGLVAPAILV